MSYYAILHDMLINTTLLLESSKLQVLPVHINKHQALDMQQLKISIFLCCFTKPEDMALVYD